MHADTLVYKTVDRLDVHADVYATKHGMPEPVLLFLHAGGLIAGGRCWMPQYQIEAYRSAGYAVVSIDHRLAPETKAPEIFTDVADAVAWIRNELPKRYAIDPSRLAVVGHSAGGYLALLCGHRVAPRPRALVSVYGYGDVLGAWYAEPDPYYGRRPPVSDEQARGAVGTRALADGSWKPRRLEFYVACRQRGTWPKEVFGLDPHTQEHELVPFCPERNVDPEFPPTLLIHGDADTDVPHESSKRMAEILRGHGVDHALLTLPGADHAFDLPPIYRPRAGRLFTATSRIVTSLSPILPHDVLRGSAPARGRRAIDAALAFLERVLA